MGPRQLCVEALRLYLLAAAVDDILGEVVRRPEVGVMGFGRRVDCNTEVANTTVLEQSKDSLAPRKVAGNTAVVVVGQSQVEIDEGPAAEM